MQPMYCRSQVSIFRQPVCWDLFVSAALLEMSGPPEQTRAQTWTASRPARRSLHTTWPTVVIRDGITRTSRKTRLYGVVIVFLSTIMVITTPPQPSWCT